MGSALLRRVLRLPVTLGVAAAVVLIMLLLPGPASGFNVAVVLDNNASNFAVGHNVPFTATITFDALDEVLEATVTADLTGPTGSGFIRTLPGIPIGPIASGTTDLAFGPLTSASPNTDTTLSGKVGHVSVLSGFAGTGYGYGYQATAIGATISISGTLTLPPNTPAGTHKLKFTVDNGRGGAPASAEVTFTVLDSLVYKLASGWSTFSVPIRVSNSKFFTTTGQGTSGQDGLVDPKNVLIAFKFDAPTQTFKQIVTTITNASTQVDNTTPIQPLQVVLVKSSVSHDATSIFLTSMTNPPSATLSAKWNAVSLAVPLNTTTKAVDQALISAFTNPAGQTGYSVVVSPSINPDPFVWTRGESATGVNLTRSRGYWVFMENADELAGFSSTPVKP